MLACDVALVVEIGFRYAEEGNRGGVFRKRAGAAFEQVGVERVICIGDPQVKAACLVDAAIAGGSSAVVPLLLHEAYSRVVAARFFDDGGSRIGRSVVDDDELPILDCLRLHARNRICDGALGIVGWNSDAEQRPSVVHRVFPLSLGFICRSILL